MIRKIITTSDGSKTIQIEVWNEQYHSIHGAIQEANHVFLKHGLRFFLESNRNTEGLSAQPEDSAIAPKAEPITILEIGFGTGLNAFLTLIEAEKQNQHITYRGIEAYPVSTAEIEQLNYVELISKNHADVFKKMHKVTWEVPHAITSKFQLEKQQTFFQDIKATDAFDIIYFDAFGARVQPDLWTEAIFTIMYKALKNKGVLVTYSAKGSVRRAMLAVGFTVDRLPGPPGKREMLRGTKHSTSDQ